MEMEMEAIWARIEAHLEKHPTLTQPFFNPAATEEEVLAAEAALGLTFPADFRAFLKLHNGQTGAQTLLGCGALFTTAEIVEQWRRFDELPSDTWPDGDSGYGGDGVKGDWWNKRWVPITFDDCGNHDCLDMDPAAGGSVGQVFHFENEYGAKPVYARSFSAWVARTADDLEAGRLVLDGAHFHYKKS